MSFTEQEIEYIRARSLARVATVGEDEQPDVVPVAIEYDGTFLWIGGNGGQVLRTRKFRNVRNGHHRIALVVDDLVSLEPFIARGVRVYGYAEQPFERDGLVGPGTYIRITPTVSWSWNLDGEPAGGVWYPMKRTVHRSPPDEAPATKSSGATEHRKA